MHMNLAEMRDWIRRQLGKTPAIDVPGIEDARPGQPAPFQPEPSNALINQCIRNAVGVVNRRFGINVQSQVGVAVAAQTDDGPYSIKMDGFDNVPPGSVNHILRMWYDDGSTSQKLKPVDFQDLNRSKVEYQTQDPSTPRHYWLNGYYVYVYPAPSTAGTLYAMVETGMLSPVDDEDDFQALPGDHYETLLCIAAQEIARISAGDAEMQARANLLMPYMTDGQDALSKWAGRKSREFQGAFKHANYRSYRGGL